MHSGTLPYDIGAEVMASVRRPFLPGLLVGTPLEIALSLPSARSVFTFDTFSSGLVHSWVLLK